MYKHDYFTHLKDLEGGEFEVKVGSFKIKLTYSSSEFSVNTRDNVGCVAFDVSDMCITEAEDGDYGAFDKVIKSLKERLDDPAFDEAPDDTSFMFIMFSKALDGQNIMTVYNLAPPRMEDYQFRIAEIDGTLVCAHSSAHGMPCIHAFYHAHSNACCGKNLRQDRSMLEEELKTIVPRAKDLLEQFIELYARGNLPEDLVEQDQN